MKIFLDSSVMIAALLSAEGGSARILELAALGVCKAYLSLHVVNEVREVIERKFPKLNPKLKNEFSKVLRFSHIKIIRTVPISFVHEAHKLVTYAKDAIVLAGAKKSGATYFITLDLRHFIRDPSVAKKSGLIIVTPGDFLHLFASRN